MTNIMPANFSLSIAQSYSDHLIVAKGFGGRSHNNQIENMKSLFNMAIDRELLLKNPFKTITKKPVNTGGNLAYTNKQKETIKKYLEINDHPLLMAVQFLYLLFGFPPGYIPYYN